MGLEVLAMTALPFVSRNNQRWAAAIILLYASVKTIIFKDKFGYLGPALAFGSFV
jgi:hypothetical protein